MPLPTPTATENEGQFMTRCEIDPIMRDDFPARDQRTAVCQNQWDKHNGKSAKMVLPRPQANESEGSFMDRCVIDRTMLDEFPNRDDRTNVCQNQWDDNRPSSKSPKASTQTLSFKFDLKTLGESEFEGYGSTFGNVDLGGDIVLPGAFSASLKQQKSAGTLPQMFYGHDPMLVPGVWMDMREDTNGLYVKGRLLMDTQLGRETRVQLKEKALRGMSIGFSINDYKKDIAFDEDGHRLLKKIDLWEVSVVSMPMNTEAKVESVKGWKRRLEYELRREANFGSQSAKTAASVCVRILAPSLKLTDPGIRDVDLPRDVDVDETAATREAIERLQDRIRASLFR